MKGEEKNENGGGIKSDSDDLIKKQKQQNIIDESETSRALMNFKSD